MTTYNGLDTPFLKASVLLKSSLILYIASFMLLYVGLAAGWVLLLNYVVGTDSESSNRVQLFSTGYQLAGFAFSLMYWAWIQQGLDRLSTKPALYEHMLAGVEEAAHTVARDVQQKRQQQQQQQHNTTASFAMSVSNSQNNKIQTVSSLLCALADAIVFVMLNDATTMRKPLKHTAADLSLPEHFRSQFQSAHSELELAHLLMDRLEDSVQELQSDKTLTGSSTGVSAAFSSSMSTLRKQLLELRASRENQSYIFIDLFARCALVLVVFFFPTVIWFQAGWYTVLVYPILMFVITGLPIAIYWYGDAFEGTPGANAIHFKQKKEVTCSRVIRYMSTQQQHTTHIFSSYYN